MSCSKVVKNYVFNQNIGLEEEHREYKEFIFKVPIDKKLAEESCKTNKFMFNKEIYDNICEYIKIYIPKYSCGYWNSNIPKGELFIGVNDFGVMKGIPFQGKFPHDLIKQKIKKTIEECVDGKIDIEQMIKIKIHKVVFDVSKTNELCNRYLQYLNEKQLYHELYSNYQMTMIKWHTRLAFVNKKLVDIVNDEKTRCELKKYIISKDPTNIVIDLLNSDYKLKSKTHVEVCLVKDDVNDPYHWVTTWKDEQLTKINSEKPLLIYDFNTLHTPKKIVTGISDMIPHWINNNDNMNLYVIHIVFKKNTIKTDGYYQYFNVQTKKWLSCIRTIYNGEPACIKYY